MDHAVAADHDQGVGSLGDGLVRHVLTLPNVPAGKLPNGETRAQQKRRDLPTDPRATAVARSGVDEQRDLDGTRAKGNWAIR